MRVDSPETIGIPAYPSSWPSSSVCERSDRLLPIVVSAKVISFERVSTDGSEVLGLEVVDERPSIFSDPSAFPSLRWEDAQKVNLEGVGELGWEINSKDVVRIAGSV